MSEVQEIEKTILTTDHRVRTLAADLSHAEQRAAVARSEISRFNQEQTELETAVQEATAQLAGIAASKEAILQEITQRSVHTETLAGSIDSKRHESGEIQARLAVLEERRSSIEREIGALQQQARELEERNDRAAQQIQQAEDQQTQSRAAIETLDVARQELLAERDRLSQQIAEITATLEGLGPSFTMPSRSGMNPALRWMHGRIGITLWKSNGPRSIRISSICPVPAGAN